MEWLSTPLAAVLGVIFLYILFVIFFGFRPKKKRFSRAAAPGPKSLQELPTDNVLLPGPNRRHYDVATRETITAALREPDAVSQLSLLLEHEQLLLAYGQTYIPYDTPELASQSIHVFFPEDAYQQEAFGQTGFPVEFHLSLKQEPSSGKLAVHGRHGSIGYVPDPHARLIETRMSSGQEFVCITLWTTDADVVPLVLVTTPEIFASLRD